jgi:antitoxin component HigA of HigAB toxin-antitoxin module
MRPGSDMKMIDIIETESDYDAALTRAEELWDAESGTPEGEELDRLIALIEEYESIHYQIHPPSKEAAARFRKEQSKKLKGSVTHYDEPTQPVWPRSKDS